MTFLVSSVAIGKKWCPRVDLNYRHADFQSAALPLSYSGMGSDMLKTLSWVGAFYDYVSHGARGIFALVQITFVRDGI